MTRVLLLGGGHTHLAAVPLLAACVRERASVALLAPSSRLLYSGMMPGWLAGQYPFDECAIDLAAVCARNGIEWIEDRIVDIDFAGREAVGERGRHPFDLASVNVGSANDLGTVVGHGLAGPPSPLVIGAKPFAAFVEQWTAWRLGCELRPGPRRLLVAGAGAAAVEIAFALAALARTPGALQGSRVKLAGAGPRLLPGLSASVAAIARASLLARGVELSLGPRYAGAADGHALFDGGTALPADLVVVATGGQPPAWLRAAAARDSVSLSPDGGIAVRSDLRSTSHPAVFAAGDCAGFVDQRVPRSGVHALRQGRVLARNLAGSIDATAPAARYAARRWTLALLNRCDGSALGAWGPLGFAGRWAWRWKDGIDRRFVGRFRMPV